MSLRRKIANRIALAYLAPLLLLLFIALSVLALRWLNRQISYASIVDILLLSTIPAALLGYLLTRRLASRLALLQHSAERLEKGDFAFRLPLHGEVDEFADLSRAFNHVTDVIAAREGALREQNQILASLNHRMESVLNATTDGIAMLDRDGRFVLVNRRFCELLGARADQLINRRISETQSIFTERFIQPGELAARIAELAASDPLSRTEIAEDVLELSGADRRFLQFYTAPVLGEEGREMIGRIVALRDVTREKELDKMKTDFVSVVSHELRTPLTSIKGYTDLLQAGAAGEITDLQNEFLGIIQGSTARLSNLINDILDISRLESGRIEVKHEPVDYYGLVTDVLRLMKAAADEKQITMDAGLPPEIPPVLGDADKVTQVLTNLVSNAIKYTPRGGWIKVLLEVNYETSVTTCVADSGIGINTEDQKKLFQKFFRADNSSTREAGGTGLGLVIARTLVELLGGTIWLESAVGKGSRFYFTLPLCHEIEQGRSKTEAAQLPDRGIGLVLVIDEDPYVRGLVQHHLHRRGYGTLGADNNLEALQKARLHRPDAITLDILMPQMEGLRILRSLKQDRATAGIPLIVLSVVGDPARGSLSLGAFSFLQKPLTADRLIQATTAMIASVRGVIPSGAADPLPALFFGDRETLTLDLMQPLLEEAAVTLAQMGIGLHSVDSAPEALTFTITRMPCVILIDMALPDEVLFELITALKAEEEASRIPIVLLTDDSCDERIHIDVEGEARNGILSLDYISDQLNYMLASPNGLLK